jgi:hypothetical protein
MRKFGTLAALVGACMVGACTTNPVGAPLVGGNAYIPDAAHGGIAEYHIENERVVYLRDRTNRWYRVELTANCPGLRLNASVNFTTDPIGNFDRSSYITTREARCAVQSIDPSPAPADKGGQARG